MSIVGRYNVTLYQVKVDKNNYTKVKIVALDSDFSVLYYCVNLVSQQDVSQIIV